MRSLQARPVWALIFWGAASALTAALFFPGVGQGPQEHRFWLPDGRCTHVPRPAGYGRLELCMLRWFNYYCKPQHVCSSHGRTHVDHLKNI